MVSASFCGPVAVRHRHKVNVRHHHQYQGHRHRHRHCASTCTSIRAAATAAHAPSSSPMAPRPGRRAAHVFEGVSWRSVECMCSELVSAVQSRSFDVILAITRGGLVPATLICEGLELRNLLSATVIFYTDDGEQFYGLTQPRFLYFPSSEQLAARRVLIVDDVWDSGRTACAVRDRVVRAGAQLVQVAVLHFKPDANLMGGAQRPDYFARSTANWIVYPWERASPKTPLITVEDDDECVVQN